MYEALKGAGLLGVNYVGGAVCLIVAAEPTTGASLHGPGLGWLVIDADSSRHRVPLTGWLQGGQVVVLSCGGSSHH